GSIPTMVNGRGIIVRPGKVTQTQALAAGRILSLRVRTGDHVKEGDLIATLDQSDITKRIEENRRALSALEDQDRRKEAAESSQVELQKRQDEMERKGLEGQRTTLNKSLADASELRPTLAARVDSNRKLIKEGLMGFATKDVSDAESA